MRRIGDVRRLRAAQFPEDAGPLAHPVQPKSYLRIDNFYTATVYNKGAEVVRMIETIVGRDGFRKGMDLYFKRHDNHAVTIEDFVAAMQDANGVDLARFKRWYHQAGTPEITVSDRYDPARKTYELTLRQETPPTPGQPLKEPLVVPVAAGFVGPDGGALAAKGEGDARGRRTERASSCSPSRSRPSASPRSRRRPCPRSSAASRRRCACAASASSA